MKKSFEIIEPTTGRIQGRNGNYALTKLVIWSGNGEQVCIDGIGQQGTIVNGGLLVEAEAFERAAERFLIRRGRKVENKFVTAYKNRKVRP